MRNIIAIILAVCAFAYSHVALSGYAQLKPPPGWSQGLGAAVPGQAGVFAFGAAANASSFKGSTVLTNAALNVAGQLVTVPVSMRLAANAATVAAEWSFGNPTAFLVLGVGSAAYLWYKESPFIIENGQWVKKDPNACYDSVCYVWYSVSDPATSTMTFQSNTAAAQAVVASKSDASASWSLGSCEGEVCQVTVFIRPDGPSVQTTLAVRRGSVVVAPTPATFPVPKPEFQEYFKDKPIPDSMPKQLPDINWPVESPVFNPDPAINPLPAPSPAAVPRPLWVPTGDPAKNPNPNPATNPDTWTQPGVRVTPSPTASDPWRVDVTPEPITKPDPSPNVDEVPDDTSTTPEAEPSKPLCELYPDIVACAKLGTPPAVTPVPNVNKPVTITKDSGWGPENGSCPSPRVLNLHGLTVNMPWDLYCQFATGIRPIVLGLAYLGAAFTFFGIGRKT